MTSLAHVHWALEGRHTDYAVSSERCPAIAAPGDHIVVNVSYVVHTSTLTLTCREKVYCPYLICTIVNMQLFSVFINGV